MSFLLGNGAGGFVPAPGSPRRAGIMPTDVAIGDFDRDRQADLAIANHETSHVTVLLAGRGFEAAAGSPFDTRSRPHVHSVAAGDLDGDGAMDLVTESVDTDSVAVLFGDGGGGFETARHFGAGLVPTSSLGSGTSTAMDGRRSWPRTREARALTVLTATGREASSPLLARRSRSGGAAQRCHRRHERGRPGRSGRPPFRRQPRERVPGTGRPAFRAAPGSPFPAGRDPTNLALGDIDGDGVLDVAASNYSSDDVTLLLSDRQARPGALVRRLACGTPPAGDGPGRSRWRRARRPGRGRLPGQRRGRLAQPSGQHETIGISILGEGEGGAKGEARRPPPTLLLPIEGSGVVLGGAANEVVQDPAIERPSVDVGHDSERASTRAALKGIDRLDLGEKPRPGG